MSEYQHWKLNTDSDNILWLTIDRADTPVNALNGAVFDEFERILDEIEKQKPAGVIIASGKRKGFIAGADITQFTKLKTADEAYDLIRQGQIILNKLEALDVPTVALINGFCMGGGTELILACRYRIACDVTDTRIALPEVKLGIHPGFAGTVRLPLLVGAPHAMDMMLTGRGLSARAAKRIGLVDEAVPARHLEKAAVKYIKTKPKTHQLSFTQRLTNAAFVRPWLGKIFYKKLAEKGVIRDHYPAPYAMVRNWIRDGARGNAMVNEAKSIAELMVGDTARNLIRVFFLQTGMKEAAKGSKFSPKRVHVIGAGTMGGDIAAYCAYKGMHVTLQDQTADRIAPAMKRAAKLFKKKLKKPRLVQLALDRLQPDVHGYGVAQADLVIEAIFEDLKVKQDLFAALESKLKPGAILATNTSSIPLQEIGTALKEPGRLVGIHFFNPVAKMPLVEVVHTDATDPQIVKDAARFVTKISRSPVVVKSEPGFLVNRCLMPYMIEAMRLLEEGVPAAVIDKIALQFGMPMGPVTLADKVGLDVCLSVAEKLTSAYGGKVPERLREMVEAGSLGIKSGKGFYDYPQGKQVKQAAGSMPSNQAEICDRLMLIMLNEAATCLHEDIAVSADAIDAGMIFGTGFAPFRGGPLQYAKTRGVDDVVSSLQTLEKQYGERFKPSLGWEQLKQGSAAAEKEPALAS